MAQIIVTRQGCATCLHSGASLRSQPCHFRNVSRGRSPPLSLDRDPHGNVQRCRSLRPEAISRWLAISLLNGRRKVSMWASLLLSTISSAMRAVAPAPSNFDADYCYALGNECCPAHCQWQDGLYGHSEESYGGTDEWKAGGVPITMMMNMERRNGKMKPVIPQGLVAPRRQALQDVRCTSRRVGKEHFVMSIPVLSSTGDRVMSAIDIHKDACSRARIIVECGP